MLLAFLIYNDGIGTIIGVAAIYAAGQGLPQQSVITAILMVQFVGIPCAFVFGNLAARIGTKRTIMIGVAVYMGISVKRIFAISWCVSAIVSAIGGILIGNINGVNITFSAVGLKVFPAVILGGLDSIPGAVLGGLIIGVLENLSGGYLDRVFGGGVKEVAPFVFLVIILMISPMVVRHQRDRAGLARHVRCGVFHQATRRTWGLPDRLRQRSRSGSFWPSSSSSHIARPISKVGTNVLYLANLIGIYIGAHGLNILTGYTGRSRLATGPSWVGAYASAILTSTRLLLIARAAGLARRRSGCSSGSVAAAQGAVPGDRDDGRAVHHRVRCATRPPLVAPRG
jgi:MFS family permease